MPVHPLVTGLAVAAALLVGACSSEAVDRSGTEASAVGTTAPPSAEAITVAVRFPSVGGVLFGAATGSVLDAEGTRVATFEFGSGWEIPDVWDRQGTLAQTGAPTSLAVELPRSGRYTFVLDEFAVSNDPCGTCERGLSGGRVEVDVTDGVVVELPPGDRTWES